MPIQPIILKLDADFFAARWNKVQNRKRDLLLCIATLENCDQEFTITEIVEASKRLKKDISKPFRCADVSQMPPWLIDNSLVYKNGFGKYSYAVPLFGGFIQRQYGEP